MSESSKVLVTATNYSLYCTEGKRLLTEAGCEIIENRLGRPHTREELLPLVGDIDAVIAGVDTWDETVFEHAPRLRHIARFGVGVDNIDLTAAAARGIQVTNVPAGNSNAVAELTVGLILSQLRNIPALQQSAKAGYWDRRVGEELAGKTVGLLGFGNIARMVARKLQGFEVDLLAYDKYPDKATAGDLGVRLMDAEEVLRQSDIVSMHLPSFPETRHMMSDRQFGLMKPGAYFVNTARGALVDEQALHRALAGGMIAGAAIDVYEQEPVLADNPLLTLDTLLATPHTAAETIETYHRVGIVTAQAIIDGLAGRQPAHLLRP